MCFKHLDFETLAYKEGPEKVIARFQLLVSSACKSPDGKNIDLIHELPKDKFEEIAYLPTTNHETAENHALIHLKQSQWSISNKNRLCKIAFYER